MLPDLLKVSKNEICIASLTCTFCLLGLKYSSAAQMFREIGALEFLAQLRPNVEPNLQICIDEVMDDLLKLPDTIVDVDPAVAYQSQSLKSSDKGNLCRLI